MCVCVCSRLLRLDWCFMDHRHTSHSSALLSLLTLLWEQNVLSQVLFPGEPNIYIFPLFLPSFLSRFDIYRKVPKDLTQPTYTGAFSKCQCLFLIINPHLNPHWVSQHFWWFIFDIHDRSAMCDFLTTFLLWSRLFIHPCVCWNQFADSVLVSLLLSLGWLIVPALMTQKDAYL